MAHSKQVLQRFNCPQHVQVDQAEAVGTAGSRLAGSQIEIHLSRRDKVLQAGFKAYGCPATIASADYLCELLKGANAKFDELERHAIIRALELPAARQHCAALAIEAMRNAFEALDKK